MEKEIFNYHKLSLYSNSRAHVKLILSIAY